jgi:hypothetical protein
LPVSLTPSGQILLYVTPAHSKGNFHVSNSENKERTKSGEQGGCERPANKKKHKILIKKAASKVKPPHVTFALGLRSRQLVRLAELCDSKEMGEHSTEV